MKMVKGAMLLASVLAGAPALAWDGENQYGPGVHADRYGRAFTYQTEQGQAVPGGVRVQPNGYGLGVGMDQYGRPVRAYDNATGEALDALDVDDDGDD